MRRALTMIHSTRAARFEAAAELHGMNITEFVEEMLRREIEVDRQPDTIPRFRVLAQDVRAFVGIGKLGLPALDAVNALAFARSIETFGRAESEGRARKIVMQDGCSVTIARKGRGVVFIVTDDATDDECRVSGTPGIARDFARIVRKAAEQASMQ